MNFEWTPDESRIHKNVAGLFDETGLAEVAKLEDADTDGVNRVTRAWLERLAQAGYFDAGVGPENRAGYLGLIPAQEELAAASCSLLLAAESSVRLFGGLLAGWAGENLKNELLPQIRSGRAVGAVALSEPAGDEPSEGRLTRGAEDGNGTILSGKKNFVTNGPIADWLAVAGDIDGRTAFFIIKSDQPGVQTGPRLKTLGYNGLAVCALDLAEVEVPAERVIGPFDNEEPIDFLTLIQDMVIAAASLGIIRRTHHAAGEHAHAHFRGNKPIFSHQEVRFKLADTFTLYQTAQLLAYRAGWFFASGDREAPALIQCAKVFNAEASETVTGLAMQIMAGQGYISGNAVEQGFRDAKYAALAGTTSEISRMGIADDILRRYT